MRLFTFVSLVYSCRVNELIDDSEVNLRTFLTRPPQLMIVYVESLIHSHDMCHSTSWPVYIDCQETVTQGESGTRREWHQKRVAGAPDKDSTYQSGVF